MVAKDCKSPYHHGNLRTALVEAGLGILAEEGIGALGLRSTARRAGVSQTAPYHHFGSKEGLLAAVAAEGLRRLAACQEEVVAGIEPTQEDPSRRIRSLGASYVRFARANPELFRLMFGPVIQHREHYPELLDAYADGYSFIEDATAAYLAQVGADEIPVRIAIAGAWAMVHGLSHLLNDGKLRPGENDDPEEAELVDTVLRLLDGGLLGLAAHKRA